MNRPIKFRAWDKDSKEMFRVVNLGFVEGKGIVISGRGGSTDTDEAILMQFTGLTDKNGKEIYEGDILKYQNPTTNHRSRHEVIWQEDKARFAMTQSLTGEEPRTFVEKRANFQRERFEVIGNIWEYPEL